MLRGGRNGLEDGLGRLRSREVTRQEGEERSTVGYASAESPGQLARERSSTTGPASGR